MKAVLFYLILIIGCGLIFGFLIITLIESRNTEIIDHCTIIDMKIVPGIYLFSAGNEFALTKCNSSKTHNLYPGPRDHIGDQFDVNKYGDIINYKHHD